MSAVGAKHCRLCGGEVAEVFCSRLAVSASSACVPVMHRARVVGCHACGLLQKLDPDISADYLDYDIFDNDPTADKIIRIPGQPDCTRSQFVADLILKQPNIGRTARVLEIGCHRGAFLSALRHRGPSLDLHGFDLNPAYAQWVAAVCGQGHYHCSDLDRLVGPFDACVLIHTLEHIPDPLGTLRTCRRLLADHGVIIIVVPNVIANPVDLFTIDHTCHFASDQLTAVLARAGFAGSIDDKTISNELVAVARVSKGALVHNAFLPVNICPSLTTFETNLINLPEGDFLVVGTAVVGALIAGLLGDRCIGFVDESPYRIGKTFLGRPVRDPREVVGQSVILGVGERSAAMLAARLTQIGIHVVNPWGPTTVTGT